MGNGLLARYADAHFKDVRNDAPDDLKKLCNKFAGMSRDEFYSGMRSYFFYGSYRAGKTWMLHALVNHCVEKYGEKSIYYITAPQLYTMFIQHQIHDSGETWASYLAGRRILVLDDLGQEYRGSASGFAETKLENFLRWRFNNLKMTVIGTNGNVDQMRTMYGESFAGFIEGEFLQVDIEVPEGYNLSRIIKEEEIAKRKTKGK